MRATVFHAPGDVRVENVPDPRVESPTDAVVRVTHACVCGSDLWFYRGISQWEEGYRCGHEWMGVVEDVGSEVRTVKPGDRVLSPFAFSDGDCEYCRKGLHTSCVHGGFWGGADSDGGQGEVVRAPLADGTLVKVPEDVGDDETILKSLLPLTDVMGTGHHAAISAGVRAGGTAAVVGDGAVGLCGVLAARRLGAERIIVLGHREARLEVARGFGATDVVSARDEAAIEEVMEMTGGGVEAVLECVGVKSSMDTAIGIARPGGAVGFVGVPQGSEELNLGRMFVSNISLHGGVAPVRAYIPELMDDVLAGSLDPSPVFDLTVGLDGVPEGYAAMNERRAIKAMVKVQ
ncbi:MAG: zinc-dependent alcohol dehydrogenase family protein [Actinomycetota bacterium]|nr:zinc-dependent alcohol dehydrogenase family protein [Actinomycetota bacterium]